MENQNVVSALTRKHAELAGELIKIEERMAKLRADLVALDGAIRIFDPDAKPEAIKPIRQIERNAWFKQGECIRAIYDILRPAAEPMTTRTITEQVMAQKEIPDGGRNVVLVTKTVLGSLGRAAGVERLMIDRTVVWRIST